MKNVDAKQNIEQEKLLRMQTQHPRDVWKTNKESASRGDVKSPRRS